MELQDVAYYNMVKFCDLQDKYALDSETDFNKFASDHYGELGLLRLNILASDFDSPGWRIIVSNSYSAYVDVAVEVATALYKSGAPLEIHDAAKTFTNTQGEGSCEIDSVHISRLHGPS